MQTKSNIFLKFVLKSLFYFIHFSYIIFQLGINDEVYLGALLSYDELSAWTTNKCIPLVREITFENAEV